MSVINLPNPVDFEWDQHNAEKNFLKHRVTKSEAEQTFFNFYLSEPDEPHSKAEQRFALLGMSDQKRILSIIFTIRNHKIRIISARSADKKERRLYEEGFEKNS